jgi:hypothetical protein
MNDVKNVSIFVCRFLDTIIYLALETLGIIIVYDTIICLTLKSPGIIISCNVVEHTTYRTRGEHANHYATDAVP